MDLKVFNSPEELAEYASALIISKIQAARDLLLCTATGNSTTLTYRKVVEHKEQFQSDALRIIKLDEWGGIPMDNPKSCESYLREKLIIPLEIREENYLSFNSNAREPAAECQRMQKLLDESGPVDLCILGLGLNGHIAFNEPAAFLQPHCHIAQLSDKALSHSMAKEMGIRPAYGLTLGMTDIFNAKQILLLITGGSKAEITRDLMKQQVTALLPASFLWLHSNVQCLCDQEACSKL
jgi:galactosamine-6-phosphate isomerase